MITYSNHDQYFSTKKVNNACILPSREKTDNYTIGNYFAESKCDKDDTCHFLHNKSNPEYIKSMKWDEEIIKKQEEHRETIPK